MNYVLRIVQASGCTQKHQAAKVLPPPSLTVDECFARAQAFECLNVTYTSAVFPSYVYSQKEFISRKPVQGLKLNFHSISGLETEMLVTICAIRNCCMLAPCLCYFWLPLSLFL